MRTNDKIPRTIKDLDGLEFESLRKAGLELLQDLCGDNWTDFNPHDPGVTILEQLCYGLVDLAYRADFDIEDLLTSPNGAMDLDHQALFPPQDILPCGPVTAADFGKLAFSENSEIEDIYLQSTAPGVHSVHVRLNRDRDIRRNLREMFAEYRILGEDLDRIAKIRPKPCFLSGTIRIRGNRSRDEIFAEIHFRCAHRIASDIRVRRFDEAIHSGLSLERIFTGPLTSQGLLDDAGFASTQRAPSLSEIVGLIMDVEGVENVSQLAVLDETGSPITDLSGADYELMFPADDTGPVLRLLPERMLAQNTFLSDAKRHFDRFEFEHRSNRENTDLLGSIPAPPTGRYRNPSRYASILEDFPPTYGIGRAGLPLGAPIQRQAAAKQLRAFLYPFEQLMADHLQLLENLPRLFSIDSTLDRTYFPADLDDDSIPGLREIRSPLGTDGAAGRIQSRYDDNHERRGRILDLMLAMYGETFPDSVLRRFNPCHAHDLESWIAMNKIRYLANIASISSRRMQPRFWQLRLSILLGLEFLESDRNLSGTHPRSRRILSDREYLKRPTTHPARANGESIALEPPPPADRKHLEPPPSWIPCISERMLQSGTDERCFRAVQQAGRTFLLFEEPGQDTAYLLASCDDLDAASQAAAQLRDWIIQANREAEGFHVVEHVRLRPRRDPLAEDDVLWDWYGLRISVVFPGWPARFSNDEFRQKAEELVASRTPAHVCPSFLWLSVDQMRVFEVLRRRWLTELDRFESRPDSDATTLDRRSERLVRFLQRAQQAYPTRSWY